MAISKVQPMRSAEIALVDAVNETLDDVSTLKEQGDIFAQSLSDIQDQIGDGFNASTTVTSVTGALSSALQSISDEIGSGFDSTNTIAAAIQALRNGSEAIDAIIGEGLFSETNTITAFAQLFRFGLSSDVTIAGGESQSTSVVFAEPFDESSKCIVIPMVVTDELLSLFELTIIDCTYSGFNFSVSNSDADEHVVNVGYVAIKVG